MEESRVCPKCGMQLVGNSNYCMGCGVNVSVDVQDAALRRDRTKELAAVSRKEFEERIRAAQGNHEKRKKKNILEQGGLAGFLLIAFGCIVGVTIGVFVLKWFFMPQETSEVFVKEVRVIDLALIDHIDPPKEKELPDADGTIDRRGKPQENSEGLDALPSDAYRTADPGKETFRGTRRIKVVGDRIMDWEDMYVWDVHGLNPQSVTYVVNRLEYLYDYLQYEFFVDYAITQTEDAVTVRMAYHHLDVEDNLTGLEKLLVIGDSQLTKSGGKKNLSLKRSKQIFQDEGWKAEGEESQTTVIYVK